jgi:hypothetical protein
MVQSEVNNEAKNGAKNGVKNGVKNALKKKCKSRKKREKKEDILRLISWSRKQTKYFSHVRQEAHVHHLISLIHHRDFHAL